ncbi:response regulator [Alkaliphilus peptidifermentans]|uniref:Transcriptional regulatory protein n=1 Tax=Alkaliphilus peptidifermentans DSM 18978 TaxID=1120976 RepID=A0A1G5K787_9FIRM|nr:response regulator [Alkaliphilus peptidifermentans]SCY96466.1 two-component system, CitB family, response regulator DctR [Alkaliphilus peptidifermentans DSM 18978]
MIKVLIIEDDPMVAEINKKYVETVDNYKVIGVANDGETGYKMLKELKPDLLILDIYMPKYNGLRLLKRIRTEGIHVDAIMVTAAKEAADIDEVLKLGAFDYLVKPFEFHRFKLTLEGYKDRISNLTSRENLTQEDIDQLTMGKRNKCYIGELDKGIHQKTMDTIRNYLCKATKSKSASAVAKDLGISRVTARRYLEYLTENGEVELEISYGTIGRPQHLYIYRR